MAFKEGEVTVGHSASQTTEGSDSFQVYRRELDYLIGSLRRLGVPACDVEDVLHEVFLVMLRRWDDFDQTRAVRPWLFGIAFRVASGHRRRGSRMVLGDDYEAADPAERPDDAAASREERRLLLRAFDTIPIERRAVLILHDVDEVPMREIAEQLQIPLFTGYSRLRKARRELDAALQASLRGDHHAR